MRLSDYDRMPTVSALMTSFPYFVSPDDPLDRVPELMRSHRIRHVPVKEGERVVGVVSESDLRGAGPDAKTVRDLSLAEPFEVDLGASLAPVLTEMAERRAALAVVTRAGRLAGILTVTDVCLALADLLQKRFGRDPWNAA